MRKPNAYYYVLYFFISFATFVKTQTQLIMDLTEILDAVRFLGDKLERYQKSNDEKFLSLRRDIDILSQSRNPRAFTTNSKSPSTELKKQR
jgi:hypothetical protein